VAFATTAGADLGDPVGGLTAAQLHAFVIGREAFEEEEVAEDGLGPVFNGTSCVECHNAGAVGGGSEIVETRFGTVRNGAFDPLVRQGGSLIQTQGLGYYGGCEYVGEHVPRRATIVAGRRTTPLFGLGLVDAVPDATFVALAARQARLSPRTAGRPNVVLDVASGERVVGRFGWKSQVPNLFQFSADAYVNEMGITTPLFPDEVCPQGNCQLLSCDPVPGVDDDLADVELFAAFMRLLAPPRPRQAVDLRAVAAGSRLFDEVGCADCHVRALTTGPSAVAALDRRTFHPFSDFLLHDMGSLGDGIVQGEASGTEMRTAPLWGLRVITTFLHDGRASTVEDAILAHEGQGRRARRRFLALTPRQRDYLLRFLGTL
jgi:CxxC motif-containing protein (DUF1111 family)